MTFSISFSQQEKGRLCRHCLFLPCDTQTTGWGIWITRHKGKFFGKRNGDTNFGRSGPAGYNFLFHHTGQGSADSRNTGISARTLGHISFFAGSQPLGCLGGLFPSAPAFVVWRHLSAYVPGAMAGFMHIYTADMALHQSAFRTYSHGTPACLIRHGSLAGKKSLSNL